MTPLPMNSTLTGGTRCSVHAWDIYAAAPAIALEIRGKPFLIRFQVTTSMPINCTKELQERAAIPQGPHLLFHELHQLALAAVVLSAYEQLASVQVVRQLDQHVMEAPKGIDLDGRHMLPGPGGASSRGIVPSAMDGRASMDHGSPNSRHHGKTGPRRGSQSTAPRASLVVC
jgi:hypothetical protein